jgi:hypothetical protein
VLAIDLGGVAPELPRTAAELGVPSVGLASVPDQDMLWPALSLLAANVPAAARLARGVLTDSVHAAGVVARAREGLARVDPPVPVGAIA